MIRRVQSDAFLLPPPPPRTHLAVGRVLGMNGPHWLRGHDCGLAGERSGASRGALALWPAFAQAELRRRAPGSTMTEAAEGAMKPVLVRYGGAVVVFAVRLDAAAAAGAGVADTDGTRNDGAEKRRSQPPPSAAEEVWADAEDFNLTAGLRWLWPTPVYTARHDGLAHGKMHRALRQLARNMLSTGRNLPVNNQHGFTSHKSLFSVEGRLPGEVWPRCRPR